MSLQIWQLFWHFHYNSTSHTIEQIIGEKNIEHAGFDTKSSLAFLDEDKIKEIENHVNENKFLSTGTVYENIVEQNLNFKFKPRHKALLLQAKKVK